MLKLFEHEPTIIMEVMVEKLFLNFDLYLC